MGRVSWSVACLPPCLYLRLFSCSLTSLSPLPHFPTSLSIRLSVSLSHKSNRTRPPPPSYAAFPNPDPIPFAMSVQDFKCSQPSQSSPSSDDKKSTTPPPSPEPSPCGQVSAALSARSRARGERRAACGVRFPAGPWREVSSGVWCRQVWVQINVMRARECRSTSSNDLWRQRFVMREQCIAGMPSYQFAVYPGVLERAHQGVLPTCVFAQVASG